MKSVLHINSSIRGAEGESSRLAARQIEALREKYPDIDVKQRDLSIDPIPHLTAATFNAFVTSPDQRTAEQGELVSLSDTLIEEIREVDAVVIGLPMYNFSIPSALKAYFDHIARVGVTFKYTDKGPVGLLEDKPVFVLTARGGRYAGTPNDLETPYIKQFLGFIGLRDIRVVYAEGLGSGGDARDQSIDNARAAITRGIAEKATA